MILTTYLNRHGINLIFRLTSTILKHTRFICWNGLYKHIHHLTLRTTIHLFCTFENAWYLYTGPQIFEKRTFYAEIIIGKTQEPLLHGHNYINHYSFSRLLKLNLDICGLVVSFGVSHPEPYFGKLNNKYIFLVYVPRCISVQYSVLINLEV